MPFGNFQRSRVSAWRKVWLANPIPYPCDAGTQPAFF